MSSLSLRVERIESLTPRIRRLLLASEGGQALPSFLPGAHIELHVPGERPMQRAYSLVNLPGENYYEIAVQLEQPSTGGSRWVHGLQEGQSLKVEAPKNHFPLSEMAKDALLIAGGIGITPILAMARALRQEGRGFALHYGGRDASGMAYLDEVRAMPEARCWISGEPASGRIPLSEVLAAPVAGRHLYVCGPKSLIADVLDTARDLGWAEDYLHSELFAGSLEVAGETAFDAELRGSGVTLHVPVGQSLLDVMVAAGLDPMFDCRRGDCGVCVTQVLEGDAEHRDICLSERDRASGSFCTCVSRARGGRLVLDL
ncbi:PDR/VanB family oxidoreductase [Stutzerimonas stutzeri]|uniref:2Fe-2S iron-sulfur cluster binding domain-containing protein n=1 Tax=Stutzerimonas stutzeri TaxID=316 RepID=A0A6I6LKS5_STUST|nr:PDR/VanB family oxidoreductase [Stutzerimonas stutzeri]QGZ29065.1 2Fe-2S iron-sulfur cluster binding domain-containing protein [Stutzerimonas stutzeri]